MINNMNALVAKAVAIWILIAAGEILNGNFRVRFLHRKYGINRAKKISFFTGITIIYTICWYTLPWVNPSNLQDCLLIGLIWMLLMLCVDIYFGRYVFRFPGFRVGPSQPIDIMEKSMKKWPQNGITRSVSG
jgi:uncharacterized BrkB/YihY/UPF0761 family membrane protein